MRTHNVTSLLERLQRKQRQQGLMLAKVERTAARLDRRRARLDALERSIASLEDRLAGPGQARPASHARVRGMRHARLIYNPTSGREADQQATRLSHIVVGLRRHGIATIIELKTAGRAARTIARDAVREDAALVIVAAGDGTITDVASPLVGTTTVLGIVPTGTMNNIARSLGIPLDIEGACALIGMGTARHIDVGRVRGDAGESPEYFLEGTGSGLATLGALAGEAFEKRRWRILPHAVQRFFGTRLAPVKVEIDGTTFETSTHLVTVCNAPLLGNNLLAAPGAKMDDGLLDVSLYDGMEETALAAHILSASRHENDGNPIHRARHVRITTAPAAPADRVPAAEALPEVIEIDAVPAALAIIVGNGIGLSIPVGSAPAAPPYALAPPAPNGSNGTNGWNHHEQNHPSNTQA